MSRPGRPLAALALAAAALALATTAAPRAARAQADGGAATTAAAPSTADRATARQLATDGIAAAERDDCPTAIERLERAEALFHAPPHLRFLARCYERVGRVVDAAEFWRRLSLEPLAPGAPPAFRDAVAEAARELPRVEALEAHLTVRLAGNYPNAAVALDGRALNAASIGLPRVLDPGEHRVTARAPGFTAAAQSVRLEPGGSETAVLELAPLPASSAGEHGGATTSNAAGASASRGVDGSRVAPASRPGAATAPRAVGAAARPWQRPLGIGVAVLGVLGLGGGVTTAVLADANFRDVVRQCPGGFCTTDHNAQLDLVDALATATNVLFVAGGALFVAGGVVFFTAPRAAPPPPNARRVTVGVVPARPARGAFGFALVGRF